MSTTASKPEGQLDPGVPRRKPASFCKCMVFSCCGVVTVCIVAFVLYFLVTFASTFLRTLFAPHSHLYYKGSIESVTNRATVVQPLVDRQQTFDLAATVWLRTSKDASHIDGKYASQAAEAEKDAHREVEGENGLEEEALYSDIIFRGLRLTDKNLHTTVNFSVPTALFRNVNLTNYDLRGSVVLIPSSPSLLDYTTNYSSYIPDSLQVLPVRQFPLGSSNPQEKTLIDRALESFAVSIPLIQFHGIQSRCTAPSFDTKAHLEDAGEAFDTEEFELEPAQPTTSAALSPQGNSASMSSLVTTNGLDVLTNHPYIVTRTQIRVLDETRLFDRTAFLKAHQNLKSTSCGQDVLTEPNQYFCKRTYRQNGNWETLLQLRVPDKSTAKSHREWAYAPFFYPSRFGLGQKDLLPLPVQRENCSDTGAAGNPAEEPTTIDVTWKVSYIGRTPAKMAAVDMFDSYRWYPFNTTDDAMIFEHDNAEMAHGLINHRYSENAHPRRRWFLLALVAVLYMATICLDVRYWFSRSSTVSLSVPGTTLIAVANILNQLDFIIARGIAEKTPFLGWVSSLSFSTVSSLALPLTQIKAVYRLEYDWSGGLIPTVHQAPATHSERANERLEARTSQQQKIALFVCALAVYYFIPLQKTAVIPAITTRPEPVDKIVGFLPTCILYAMDLVGIVLQIVLNFQSRSFGGKSRVSAVLTLVLRLAELARFVPALVGRFAIRDALHVQNIVETVIALVIAWQALMLPSPRDAPDDDHIE